MTDEKKQPMPGFTIRCDKCGSERIRAFNTIGYSDWTGRWGCSGIACLGCGAECFIDGDGDEPSIDWD